MGEMEELTKLSRDIGAQNDARALEEANAKSRMAAAKAGKPDPMQIINKFDIPKEGLPLNPLTFPEVQKIWGAVHVLNLEDLCKLLGDVLGAIQHIKIPQAPEVQTIKGQVTTDIKIPSSFTIDNLVPIKDGLAALILEVRALQKVKQPNIKVDSPTVNFDMDKIIKKLDAVLKAVKGIKIPEPTMPEMPTFPDFPRDKDGYPLFKIIDLPVPSSKSENILDKYLAADIDDDASPNYFGNLAADGSWYILKEDTTANTLRYVAGNSGYADAWDGRAGLDYVYYNEAF